MSNTEYIIKVVITDHVADVDMAVVTACHGIMGMATATGRLAEIHATRIDPGVPGKRNPRRQPVFSEENGVLLVQQNWRQQNERLLSAGARALERAEVDDPGEAAMILEQVVKLDGTYVEPQAPRGVRR